MIVCMNNKKTYVLFRQVAPPVSIRVHWDQRKLSRSSGVLPLDPLSVRIPLLLKTVRNLQRGSVIEVIEPHASVR